MTGWPVGRSRTQSRSFGTARAARMRSGGLSQRRGQFAVVEASVAHRHCHRQGPFAFVEQVQESIDGMERRGHPARVGRRACSGLAGTVAGCARFLQRGGRCWAASPVRRLYAGPGHERKPATHATPSS
jgi:hypothetical protein